LIPAEEEVKEPKDQGIQKPSEPEKEQNEIITVPAHEYKQLK
jgi:hypothetical protein